MNCTPFLRQVGYTHTKKWGVLLFLLPPFIKEICMSEAFLQMAGVFSQLELAMIRARVRSGMENAKGKQIGRPQVTADDVPSGFLRHYPAYKRGQLNVSELARVCNISRTTAYKYIGLLEV